MAKIIPISKIGGLSKGLKKQGKVIVLAGGCFDLLHPGHVIFLERAKKSGDILVILLESDEKIKAVKGINRPVHNQHERAVVLSALRSVDYIVMLPIFKKDSDYEQLVLQIKPDIIAATYKTGNNQYYKKAARLSGAKLKFVTELIGSHSTSSLISSITVQ